MRRHPAQHICNVMFSSCMNPFQVKPGQILRPTYLPGPKRALSWQVGKWHVICNNAHWMRIALQICAPFPQSKHHSKKFLLPNGVIALCRIKRCALIRQRSPPLHENCSHSCGASISPDFKWLFEVRQCKDWRLLQAALEPVKTSLTLRCPNEWNIFACELGQRCQSAGSSQEYTS